MYMFYSDGVLNPKELCLIYLIVVDGVEASKWNILVKSTYADEIVCGVESRE